jgi:hypothetical protein
MARVRESIALAKAPPAAPPTTTPSGSPGAERFEDPSPALLAHAADLIHSDVGSVVAQVKERCATYLSALCDRRYGAVEFEPTGRSHLSTAEGRVPVGALPVADLDLYFLALRFSLIETVSVRAKIPVIIEDCLDPLGESHQALLGKILKQLGSVTQVLHVTSVRAFGEMADASISL